MRKMLQQNLSDEIKSKLKISDVISQRISLNKKGENRFIALCPFHSEKTPSFNVLDDKGFYHCFGCGKNGDIFNFVMEMDKLDFKQAVKLLSLQAGISIHDNVYQKNSLIYNILEESMLFFSKKLLDDEGKITRQYLHDRGINYEISVKFSLGYAPHLNSKITLLNYLTDKGFTLEDICKSGLAKKKSQSGDRISPYFINRLMIPIISQYGKVLGFGARTLGNIQPKYLNSPENEVFKKRKILYGTNNIKKRPEFNNYLILTEGYMDVIALRNFGFPAIASLGTSITEVQVEQALNLSDNIFVVFDGDEAGKNAMLRAFEKFLKLLKLGKKIKFVFLSDNLDPEEYIRQKGLKLFKTKLEKGLSIVDMIWFMGLKLKKDDQPESNAIFWKFVRDKVNLITNFDLRIAIKDELEKRIKNKRYKNKFLNINNNRSFMFNHTTNSVLPEIGVDLRYKAILMLIIHFPDLYHHVKKNIINVKFKNLEFNEIKEELLKICSAMPNINTMSLKTILKNKGYASKLDDFNSNNIFSRFPLTSKELNLEKCKLLIDELIYMVEKSEIKKSNNLS